VTYFKASTRTKGIWNVTDIINEDSPEIPASLDTDTDAPAEYVQSAKPSQPELSQDEKQKLKELMDRIDKLQKELDHQKEYEKSLNEFEKKITTQTNYVTKPPDAMQTYFISKGQLITKQLNDKERLPDYYVYKIPRLFFHEKESDYIASLTGLSTHHHEFELMLQRISSLSYETQHAKHEYKRQVAQTAESIITIMTKRIQSTQTWKYYTNYFLQILKDKKQQHIEHFHEYITSKSKLLTDQVISNPNFKSRTELETNMEHYNKSNSFTVELEKIKLEALAEFIKQQIFLPRQQFENKPSKESTKVLNDFIEQKKKEMNTEPNYKGLGVEHFKLISKLLQTITLYYRCFQLQLPLFESAPQLMDKIHHNTVITISTSTGSGKENNSFILSFTQISK
jgi:hypothetical protein